MGVSNGCGGGGGGGGGGGLPDRLELPGSVRQPLVSPRLPLRPANLSLSCCLALNVGGRRPGTSQPALNHRDRFVELCGHRLVGPGSRSSSRFRWFCSLPVDLVGFSVAVRACVFVGCFYEQVLVQCTIRA